MVKRILIEEHDLNKEYNIQTAEYENQFYHIYFIRYETLKPILLDKIMNLKDDVKFNTIDLTQKDEKCWTIGVVYNKMNGKPSIVPEVKKDLWVVEATPVDHYYGSGDETYIEDMTGRLLLDFNNYNGVPLITGSVVAIQGTKGHDNIFFVEKAVLPGLLEQPHNLKSLKDNQNKYIAFLSGLEISGNEIDDNLLLLKDYLLGALELGEVKAQDIIQLIIAGNIFTKESNIALTSANIDSYLYDISLSLPIHLISGPNDPTSRIIFPQTALHRSFFKMSNKQSTFQTMPNPYQFQIGNINVLGTAGQNIKDIKKYASLNDIQALEYSLNSTHVIPTSPDSCGSYPFKLDDPFIIKQCPNIYFSANHDSFSKGKVNEDGKVVRLINIPSFKICPQLVLVNIKDLTVEVIEF